MLIHVALSRLQRVNNFYNATASVRDILSNVICKRFKSRVLARSNPQVARLCALRLSVRFP